MPPRLDRPRLASKAPVAPLKAPDPPVRPLAPAVPQERLNGRLRTVDLGLFSGRKPVFVGIDQSLTGFGLAAYSTDGTGFLWLYRSEARGVRRLFDIQSFIKTAITSVILQCGRPEHVVMEAYGFSSQMGHALGECGATTKMALVNTLGLCEKVAYPTTPTPQQVKKFATGKGNAKKDDMKLAVYKKWGVELSDENLADAYTMARMAAAIEVPEHMDYEYERQVIGVLERHTEWPTLDTTTTPSRSSGKAKKAS